MHRHSKTGLHDKRPSLVGDFSSTKQLGQVLFFSEIALPASAPFAAMVS